VIPKRLLSIIDYVIDYIGDNSDDWFKIKMEIINNFPPNERSRFSRRHYSTKKHILNSFDKKVITYWESKTGMKLWVDPNKLHPDNWTAKGRGCGLRKFNEQRRRQKEAETTD